ncbi:hypothetical protein BGX33_005859 [Mortierella sp. NVP41]|nr:hypothetical protein BGX33_005859 [Mortierella sp. NVP41]
MTQEDEPQEQVQALRSIVKSTLTAITTSSPGKEDIVYVDYHRDPDTQKAILLWDDIIMAFNDALHVRHKAKVLPFLKGPDFRILDPRRIAAFPGTTLDVIIEGKVEQTEPAPNKSSQEAPQEQEDESQKTPQDTPTDAATKQNPQYGLEEVAMASLAINENPAVTLANSRAPQTGDNDPTNNKNKYQRAPELHLEDFEQTRTNAELGDTAAQVKLGDMYLKGKLTPQDYKAALEWYLKAAEQEDPDAQCQVGNIHRNGHGVPQNYSLAMEWYHRAAQQGNAAAQYNIDKVYHYGHSFLRDHKLATEWYLKAAEQGFALAQRCLGNLYVHGDGVPLDYTKAMEWFLKASSQGHAQAQADIGFLYYYGFKA